MKPLIVYITKQISSWEIERQTSNDYDYKQYCYGRIESYNDILKKLITLDNK